jgi:hypothetical protein
MEIQDMQDRKISEQAEGESQVQARQGKLKLETGKDRRVRDDRQDRTANFEDLRQDSLKQQPGYIIACYSMFWLGSGTYPVTEFFLST